MVELADPTGISEAIAAIGEAFSAAGAAEAGAGAAEAGAFGAGAAGAAEAAGAVAGAFGAGDFISGLGGLSGIGSGSAVELSIPASFGAGSGVPTAAEFVEGLGGPSSIGKGAAVDLLPSGTAAQESNALSPGVKDALKTGAIGLNGVQSSASLIKQLTGLGLGPQAPDLASIMAQNNLRQDQALGSVIGSSTADAAAKGLGGASPNFLAALISKNAGQPGADQEALKLLLQGNQ